MQLERRSNLIFCRTSKDGKVWPALSKIPALISELKGILVEVGFFHSTYGEQLSFIKFDDFTIVEQK